MEQSARRRPWTRRVIGTAVLCALATLGGCNGSGGEGTGGSSNHAAVRTYSLGATITGLNSSGLVLLVNLSRDSRRNQGVRVQRAATTGLPGVPCPCNWGGSRTTTVSVPTQSTTQQLAGSLASGMSYSVSIQAQPVGEVCSVADGTGTVQMNVPPVIVSCVDQSYTVGGSITGLTVSGLVLLDNGGDALTLSANSTQFAMSTPVTYGSDYAITVQTSPTELICTVSNGTGSMGAGAVTSVIVDCLPDFTLLHSFVGGSSDGSELYHVLFQATDGSFYGTTWKGGASNGGAVFAVTASGTASVLYSFASTPYAGLMQGNDGNFYGTTAGRGTYNRGTVFELTPGGTETVLHVFPKTTTTDGQEPYAGVIQGSDGNFYGTTYFGGPSDVGVVFEVTPGGAETVLHSFAGGSGDDGTFFKVALQ